MRRIILLSLVTVLYAAEMFDIDLAVVPGLSVKNVVVYSFLCGLMLESMIQKGGKGGSLLVVHATFVGLIIYSWLAWLLFTNLNVFQLEYEIQDRRFTVLGSLLWLKSGFVDQYAFFLAFFLGLDKVEDASWVARRLIWLIVLSNAVTIIDAFDIPDLGIIHQRLDGRVSGPLRESNQSAAFAVFFLPSIAAAALSTRGLGRIALAGGAFLTVMVIILATSRGALVGLVLGLALGMLLMRRHLGAAGIIKISVATALTIGVAVSVASVRYPDLLEYRFLEKPLANTETFTGGRSRIWTELIALQLDQPITLLCGFGFGTSRALHKLATHNTYLEWFVELGVVGLMLYVLLLGSVARIARRAVDRAQGELQLHLGAFLFGLLSLCVAISFVNLYRPWLYIWAFIGLMMRIAAEVLTAPASASTSVQAGPSPDPGTQAHR